MDKSKAVIGGLLIAFALAGLGTWAWRNFGVSPKPAAKGTLATVPSTAKEIVYYFHTNFRCETCRSFEAYTRAELVADFSRELKDGTIEFQVVNVEAKGNEHFVQDYQLETKSVVLVAPGKKTRWKNLDQIWHKISTEAGFKKYIQAEVSAFLAGAS